MLEKGAGVSSVASVAAFLPVPYAAVYSASKSFVLYFSEALYGEYADAGISVMALSPGGTQTDFARVANPDIDRSGSQMDTPESVAVFGLDQLALGKSSAIPGTKNRINTTLPRLLPRAKVIQITKKIWLKALGGT